MVNREYGVRVAGVIVAVALMCPGCHDAAVEEEGQDIAEYKRLQQQIGKVKAELQTTEHTLVQAKRLDVRTERELIKKLSGQSKVQTPFTVADIDNLPAKQRDVEYFQMDWEEQQQLLQALQREYAELEYLANNYEERLNAFKEDHPVD